MRKAFCAVPAKYLKIRFAAPQARALGDFWNCAQMIVAFAMSGQVHIAKYISAPMSDRYSDGLTGTSEMQSA